jgi:hypothetical protein
MSPYLDRSRQYNDALQELLKKKQCGKIEASRESRAVKIVDFIDVHTDLWKRMGSWRSAEACAMLEEAVPTHGQTKAVACAKA